MASYSTFSNTDPATAQWLASLGTLDTLMAHLQGPIEGLLAVAVKVLPCACDSGMVYQSSRSYRFAWFRCDAWVHRDNDEYSGLTVDVGLWRIMLAFHNQSKAVRDAKDRASARHRL